MDAHRSHLEKEKAFTREREAIAQSRRELPWLKVEDSYTFDAGDGVERSLVDLFGSHSQLIIYHFMFGPDWGNEGCPICSFWADNHNGTHVHLAHRDTAFACVSRASIEQIATYKTRMGWDFPWVSSGDSSFNYDFGASASRAQVEAGELVYNLETSQAMGPDSPSVSVFARQGDDVYLTYQVSARGLDLFNTAYHYLDITPKGRDEANLPWNMAWLHRHDSYPNVKEQP